MKYRALEAGFIGHYIREGEVFEFDGPAPSWCEQVPEEDLPPAAPSVEEGDAPEQPEQEEERETTPAPQKPQKKQKKQTHRNAADVI